MSQILLREAKPSDQVPVAQLAATAFWSDELFGDLIHPYRSKYPDDMHLYWLKQMRKVWGAPSNHFLVTTVQADDGSEIVTGMAWWSRKGKDAPEYKPLEDEQIELPQNRAADPAMEDVLGRSHGFTSHLWEGLADYSISFFFRWF